MDYFARAVLRRRYLIGERLFDAVSPFRDPSSFIPLSSLVERLENR